MGTDPPLYLETPEDLAAAPTAPRTNWAPHRCGKCDAPFQGVRTDIFCAEHRGLAANRRRRSCVRCGAPRPVNVPGYFCAKCRLERRRLNWREKQRSARERERQLRAGRSWA
jgi:hypothetical protein